MQYTGIVTLTEKHSLLELDKVQRQISELKSEWSSFCARLHNCDAHISWDNKLDELQYNLANPLFSFVIF